MSVAQDGILVEGGQELGALCVHCHPPRVLFVSRWLQPVTILQCESSLQAIGPCGWLYVHSNRPAAGSLQLGL